MKKKIRTIVLDDFDKMLNVSFNYCKFGENEKIQDAARKINGIAYDTIKYVNRYVKKTKKRKKKK
jgi:hypothetical protein